MSRDVTASPSEGEIVESGSEKANTLTTTNHDLSVDRESRNRPSRSPSPTIAEYAPSFIHDRGRERSRSPYRPPRGLKRPLEHDHNERIRNDPRHFRVRYEDTGRTSSSGQHHQRRAEAHRSAVNGAWRAKATSDTKHQRLHRDRHQKISQYEAHDAANALESQRPHAPHDGEGAQARGHTFNDHYAASPVASRETIAKPDLQTTGQLENFAGNNDATSDKSEANIGIQGAPPEAVNEADLIEARRRRREAIKAKHRIDSTSQSNQTVPAESEPDKSEDLEKVYTQPLRISPAESLKPAMPPLSFMRDQQSGLPRISPPPTRVTVSVDTEVFSPVSALQATGTEDGPSAADYDPKMDMQEDKLRQDAMASAPPNEVGTPLEDEDPHAAPALNSVSDPSSGDFDMFAEDEGSVIVAPVSGAPKIAPQRGENGTLAANVQAIDMRMLDDWDDPEGYYKVLLGELLDGRYHVTSNLGKGMFSGVVRATDQSNARLVAIKIVRNNETMFKAGQKEIDILQKLKLADVEDKKHLVRLERSFEHKGHLCMVFENLSINLREVLKKFGRDVGINLKAVRAYAQQMFLGLGLLRKCNVLHADLKPDNVLVNDSRNLLKICDLGSASDASDAEITQYLVSRFYRAPEIILGLPYDFAVDMWSIGCTLFELYTGKILFTGRNNNQMLRAMMECRGKFGHKMLRKAQFAGHHFDDLLNFRSVEKDRLTGKDTVRLVNIVKPTRDLRTRLTANAKGLSDTEMKDLLSFADLLDRCLNLNPERRCTPNEALRHPFITKQK